MIMRKLGLLGMLAAFMLVAYSCNNNEVAPESGAIIELGVFDAPETETGNEGGRMNTTVLHPQDLLPTCGDLSLIRKVNIVVNGEAFVLEPKWFPALGKFQIQLPHTTPGTYTVSALAMLDADDEPLYMTPEAGSDFAPFVKKALPFDFEIKNGEKIVTQADLLCWCPADIPFFGQSIFEFEKCVAFKVWAFYNICGDFGHEEGQLSGGIYFPSTGYFSPIGFAHDHYYAYAKYCLDDWYDTVIVYLRAESANGVVQYREIPLPAWPLYYVKGKLIHFNDSCEPNVCRQPWVAGTVEALGIENFNADDYDPSELTEEEYNEIIAKMTN